MTPLTQQQINITGGELAVQRLGSGAPLVLIHGMATDQRLWAPQVATLKQRYQLISYDMRGFGASTKPDTPYRAEDDLAELLTTLDLDSAHILGLSLGSAVATRFALAYPTMTRSLIIAGPVLQGFDDADDFKQALKTVWAIARDQGVEAAKAAWLKLPLFTTLLESAEWSDLFRTMVNDYDGWHWLHRDPEIWPEIQPAQRLAQITAPTLIIAGDQEMAGLQGAGNFMQQQIPGASQVTLKAAGHVVNLEQPQLFNQAVDNFLTRLSG